MVIINDKYESKKITRIERHVKFSLKCVINTHDPSTPNKSSWSSLLIASYSVISKSPVASIFAVYFGLSVFGSVVALLVF